MTEKENFNIWVLENAKDWLKIGEFTRKNEEDKRNFTKFVEMKPDDDTTDPSYISCHQSSNGLRKIYEVEEEKEIVKFPFLV